MGRTFKIIAGLLLAAIVLVVFAKPIRRFTGGALTGDNAGEGTSQPPTAKVERGSVVTRVEVAGDVVPTVQVEVKAEVGARIEKIHVKEGDEVRAGDPLVDLDNTELVTEKSGAETDISIAELELEQASRNFDRDEKLMAASLVTEKQFQDRITERDIAGRKLVRAKQKLENIETKLTKTRIVAPLAGKVLTLPVVEGQVAIAAASVSSGTLLMTIADLASLELDCHVNQVDVSKLKPGAPFTFTVDSLGDTEMRGEIATIAPMATVSNGVKGFGVKLAIIESDPRLRPGMTADAVIPTGTASDVLTAPVSAVFAAQGGKGRVVFVQRTGQAAEERPVQVGLSNLDRVEILSGVTEGETLLLVRPEAPKEIPKKG